MWTGGSPLQRLGAPPSCGSFTCVPFVEDTVGTVELVNRSKPTPIQRSSIKENGRVDLPTRKDRIALPVGDVVLGPVDHSAGEILRSLASSLEQLQQILE